MNTHKTNNDRHMLASLLIGMQLASPRERPQAPIRWPRPGEERGWGGSKVGTCPAATVAAAKAAGEAGFGWLSCRAAAPSEGGEAVGGDTRDFKGREATGFYSARLGPYMGRPKPNNNPILFIIYYVSIPFRNQEFIQRPHHTQDLK